MFDSKTRTVVIVGAQWGDEGKGKLVDVLAERADWVVRYQGGANAGHTVHIGDKSFVLHQVPSGILHPGVRCAIGNGVVLDPATLFTEIDELRGDGIDVQGRLYVSDRAHLVLQRWLCLCYPHWAAAAWMDTLLRKLAKRLSLLRQTKGRCPANGSAIRRDAEPVSSPARSSRS
jgi:hypothetical protein